MKSRTPSFSREVEALLDQREIDVECWQCGVKTPLTLAWVSQRRDMCCTTCGNLIILNTSRLQGEVVRLRRQWGALYTQMNGVLTDLTPLPRRSPVQAKPKPHLDLALATARLAR